MRRLPVGCVLLALAAAAIVGRADKPGPPKQGISDPKPGGAPAPPSADVTTIAGAYAFRTYCASCHGADGKGEGPLADNLRYHPPDLSLLSARNGGGFPSEKILRIVDGRSPIKGHGGPDMPVWGDAFKNADTGYDDKRVQEKIRSLVEYLRTIQAK